MAGDTDVAIVGAGPYGLSIAAHLRALRVEHRIFGHPMRNWLEHMPDGMQLKSDGFASSLYDPLGRLTLRQYCRQRGLDYDDLRIPVALDTFNRYALAFQRQMVPQVETRLVTAIAPAPAGFGLQLDNGEALRARRVVLGIGVEHFRHIPAELSHLPGSHVSHSAENKDVRRFRSGEVAVIGAGASAIDMAVLLHEAGTKVTLIARRPELELHTQMRLPRTLGDRLVAPTSGIGPGWRSRFFCDAPLLFHRLPEATRLRIVKQHLGPAGGWFMRERFAAVPRRLGQRPLGADVADGRIRLTLGDQAGGQQQVTFDHVVTATGYRPDLGRLAFLDPALLSRLALADGAPVLSTRFESSVPNFYVVGPAAANSFGPVMRFAFGAKFTAPRIARHLRATARQAATPRAPAVELPGILGEVRRDRPPVAG